MNKQEIIEALEKVGDVRGGKVTLHFSDQGDLMKVQIDCIAWKRTFQKPSKSLAS